MFIIRQRTDGRVNFMRDGVDRKDPLRNVGSEGFTIFKNLPRNTEQHDPYFEIHEVSSKREARAKAEMLGFEVGDNLHVPAAEVKAKKAAKEKARNKERAEAKAKAIAEAEAKAKKAAESDGDGRGQSEGDSESKPQE